MTPASQIVAFPLTSNFPPASSYVTTSPRIERESRTISTLPANSVTPSLMIRVVSERISVLPASTGSEYRGLSGNSRSTGHSRHDAVSPMNAFAGAHSAPLRQSQSILVICSWHRLSDADSYQRSVKIAQIDASINKRRKRTKRSPMGALIMQNIARHRASKIQLGLVHIDEISKNTAATRKLSAP